jgi:ferric-dicitrate binding protein FerR (iron transport regulator)
MNIHSIEEVVANDFFQAWYFKNDEKKAREWEHLLLENPELVRLTTESSAWMKENYFPEQEISNDQANDAWSRFELERKDTPVIEMKRQPRRWWIPAAAAVLLVVAGFMYWRNVPGRTTLDSDFGTISSYSLPDGSEVLLNANSNISLKKDWKEGEDREVWLDGEAFFRIQKNPSKNRFIVHAKTMDIIVTGTQFNAVSRDDESSVLLTEGSVIIKSNDGKEIHLAPGEFVKISNNTSEKHPADKERLLAWTQEKLDFDQTPMNEVAKVINRHYGVKVTLSDKVAADKKISGIMPNDNLDVLVQALEATGDFRITRENNEIIISGQ